MKAKTAMPAITAATAASPPTRALHPPAPRPPLALGPPFALGQERPLLLVEVRPVPLLPEGEPRAAVELALVATGGLPLRRGVGQTAVLTELLAVLADPAAQLAASRG